MAVKGLKNDFSKKGWGPTGVKGKGRGRLPGKENLGARDVTHTTKTNIYKIKKREKKKQKQEKAKNK